jgi:hypothetical protein
MSSATGNPTRDRILYDVLYKLGGSPSFGATVAALPDDFDLDKIEHSNAVKILRLAAPHGRIMIDSTPDGAPLSSAPEPVETVEAAPNAEDFLLQPEPVADEPPVTLDEANVDVLMAENALGEARLALRRAQQQIKDCRAVMADAITRWQTGGPQWTAEMNTRAHLRASQEARIQRVQGGGTRAGQSPGGKSYIDMAAKHGRDMSPEGAARSRMLNGSHRGAFPTSMKFQNNHDPRKGPVVKLPSER